MLRRIGTVATLSRCRVSRVSIREAGGLLSGGFQVTRQVPVVCSLRSSAVLRSTEGERKIAEILEERLSPSYINVRDISGGCGSMYEIVIDSEKFKGKRTLLQHKMVNEALGADIVKSLHGLTIRIGNPGAET